jgi:hypothetical protein
MEIAALGSVYGCDNDGLAAGDQTMLSPRWWRIEVGVVSGL